MDLVLDVVFRRLRRLSQSFLKNVGKFKFDLPMFLNQSERPRSGISVPQEHGRTTFDVDLVVQLSPENLRRAFAGLSAIGYRLLIPVTAEGFVDASTREAWKREKGMFV